MFEIIIQSYQSYANYLWHEITHPSWKNYFYWLLLVSLFFFALELLKPWRKNQARFRKDFWLDFFYMYFNFFLFSLVIYNAASDVVVNALNNAIKWLSGGFDLQASNPLMTLPFWAILLIGFVVRDFVQWWVHRLLHRVPRLWEFHKVHHSVQEMGFAAHLRYHWMETIVYRTVEYLPLALLGIGLYDFFIIHIFTLAWGHFNHSNISIHPRISGGVVGFLMALVVVMGFFEVNVLANPSIVIQIFTLVLGILVGVIVLGPFMRIVFNSPEMHIWHHAKYLPEEYPYGVNYGLTLAIWDYIFGKAYVPDTGRDIPLGFSGVEEFPQGFTAQVLHGLKKPKT